MKITMTGLEDVRAVLEPELFQRAFRATVNDMIKKGRTKTSTTIREKYTVKAAVLKSHMSMQLVSPAKPTGWIRVDGPTMALTSFAGTRQTATGVSVKIKKDGPRKVIKHAFIATVAKQKAGGAVSESTVAFQRDWRRHNPTAAVGSRVSKPWAALPRQYRYPVHHVSTIGPVGMFNQQYVDQVVQAMVDAEAQKDFERNYAFYASK